MQPVGYCCPNPSNCQAGLDEKVTVAKGVARPAGRIVLSPSEELPALAAKRDSKYLGRLLEGLPVLAGDTVRATLSVEVPDVGWDDVGGLDDVKRELTETVHWPLQHPELFRIAATSPASG